MNTSFSKIVIAVFLASFSINLNARQIVSKQILLSDHLSVTESTDIYQDKDGFIWIGTFNGVARYDGYDIRVFRNNYKQPAILTSNTIECFTEDESQLWVGTDKGISLINKKTLQITPFTDSTLVNKNIRFLLADSKGSIWISSSSGLYRYTNGKLEHKQPSFDRDFDANSICEDRLGNIWILNWKKGIYKYVAEKDNFIEFPPIGQANNPFRIYQDNEGRYWVATWGDGLWRFDPNAISTKMYIPQSSINSVWNQSENIFYDIIQDDVYGYIWALSYSGIKTLRINADHKLEQVHIRDLEYQPDGIDPIYPYTRFIKDRNGSLWLNSYDKICAIFFSEEKVKNYMMSNMPNDIGIDPSIICFGRDRKGMVWFNQTWTGLCLFDESTGRLAYGNRMGIGIHINQVIPSRTSDFVWASQIQSSIVRKMKQIDMKIVVSEVIDLARIRPAAGKIQQMYEDTKENLWIGTEHGLFILNTKIESKPLLVNEIDGVTAIAEDRLGTIWVSSGREILQISHDSPCRIVKAYSPRLTTPGDRIESLCTDKNNNIWFASSMGRVFKIDKETSLISDQSVACALDGERVLRLLAQDDGIWIVQSKRIIRHTTMGENYLYNVADDNIYVSSFRYGDAFIDNDKLYAAGTKGYISIEPTDEPTPLEDHKVLITDIRMDGKSILSAAQSEKHSASVEELKLPHDSRNIEIDFSTLNYQHISRMEYAYRLDGEDSRWTYLSNGKRTAFFSHLNEGKYTFLVKSRSLDNEWSDEVTQLTITRLPAFYETWYARLAYTLIAILSIYLILRIYHKRMDRRHKRIFQEELTQAKLNYFTNITHELLTPLTVISCVADDMEKSVQNMDQHTGILRTNVRRLKSLLVQILDFRKIESNNMPLHVTFGHVSPFIAGVTASNFEYLAQQKHIRFSIQVAKGIWGYIDFEKLDKVLFNLLSNAIKYTPENKQVELSAYSIQDEGVDTLIVKVADEGIGIDPKEVGRIFTKFYNNKNRVGYESNGIGLSLTKDLVTLHHGTIQVESEPGKGSIFTVKLPLERQVYSSQEIAEPEILPIQQVDSMGQDESVDKPTILYIDDSLDLRELMKSMLHRKYQILLARDGEEGIEIVNTKIVDIVICDLMMPRMDGLEFCRQLKANVQTSHIPVLILTAKNTSEDQIEAYKIGVESFITKPFDMNILEARIRNLLQARQARQQRFRTNMDVNISNLDYQTADEQFLNDAIACIENHLDDPQFDIPQMADELHVSKSTLSRKLKVMTNLTPGDFMKNIKLKHACNLLKKKSITISEVAYATGFNNPKYFSRCFKDEFGMPPTEYVDRLEEGPFES